MTPSIDTVIKRPSVAFAPSWFDPRHGPFAASRPPCCERFVADAAWVTPTGAPTPPHRESAPNDTDAVDATT
jgi:hypothetical protein